MIRLQDLIAAARPKRWLALAVLCPLLHAPRVSAQATAVTGAGGASPLQLHIVIIDGDQALNNIRQRTAREPVVLIEDENHKPVAGAAVVFLVHGSASGAGGTFAGASSFATVSDAAGHAVGTGFFPNSLSGQFSIEVSASVGAGAAVATATALIIQSNILTLAAASSSAIGVVHVSRFGSKFWLTAGATVGTVGVIATTVVLTNKTGASISAGGGGVTHP